MSIVELEPLEVACGFVFGPRRSPQLPSATSGTPEPLSVALNRILSDALAKPPCYVAFSGGRDSSVMLAAAAHVAQSRGLPAPIPLTAFYPDYPSSWETDWQELVVSHLALQEWERFEVRSELDALGGLATDVMAKHGLYWPANAHSMVLFARKAAGGTLLTGGGGDELFEEWYWRRARLRELLRLRPYRRVVKWTAYYQLPLRLQQRVRHYDEMDVPWLREGALRELNAAMQRSKEASPSYREALETYISSRYLECLRSTLDTLADDEGVTLVEPFYDPAVIRAVGRERPQWGFDSRTQVFEHFFSDLLPPEVLRRNTKAYFTGAAWGPGARSFAATWDGRAGVDPTVVDTAALRAAWGAEVPDARSVSLLQAAWLTTQRSGAGQFA